MKSWKAALGVGAACAACCAVPLLGGAATLAAGSASLAAVGSALLACADELLPLAFALLGLAALGAAAVLWRRRKTRLTAPACALPVDEQPGRKACACPPGRCG
ncbi:LPXTG cell wall anchor domain-containing protein [Piscinibacter gummiphilus]|uniref:LPXTG cell wall anchor domain-containing protein n=1 Tax=Piscinibacter gummiphilus TaxID=946333 RepID=A0ABZ0D3Y8_9BURK|nr:LPXTG cell wall anchor domain-containing protein [Piscinibacter gummiphilus]WOB10226.1 LPXTG cell wall anchor domain-containing protein [Piscinibacter gummiphilus]